MTAISEISKLSWRAIENDYSLDQYEEELEIIKNKKRKDVYKRQVPADAMSSKIRVSMCSWNH